MAIDYTLEFACEPKRRFGLEGLSDRLRLLEDLHGELALTPEQTASVREVVFELRPLAFHCAKCPANHRNREFGCFGRVETPISEEAEDWLSELLPLTLTPSEIPTRDQRLQIQAMTDLIVRLKTMEVTGRMLDERRSKTQELDPTAIAEYRKGFRRSYGKIFRRTSITTSQILETLLLRNTIPPTLAEPLCRALGVWQEAGVAEDGVVEMAFTTPIEGDDEPTLAQLKLLFYACMIACSLGVNVLTEVHAAKAAPTPQPVADL